MEQQLQQSVAAEAEVERGHLRAHMREAADMLGRRGRWAYLAWVVAWAAALVFTAVTFWSSGRVGF